ncbi:MAG: LPS assembly lipoprotein LptE [Ignavibacteriales bacterium]|nr:LPS assembly lipoprotein LptE [Ignavibacteriales bacterium]
MIYKLKNLTYSLFVILLVVNFTGCFYSFTGASVAPHLKSVAIPVFEDKSGSGEPNLRETFTQKQIQKFIDDNTLQVAEKVNADAVLECAIISMNDAPNVVTSVERNETVSSRRINITVKVVFKDLVQKKIISDKKYTNYGDYDTKDNVVEARRQAIESAINKLTDDILLGTVSNW